MGGRDGGRVRGCPLGAVNGAEVRLVVPGDGIHRFEHGQVRDGHEAGLRQRILGARGRKRDHVPVLNGVCIGHARTANSQCDGRQRGPL